MSCVVYLTNKKSGYMYAYESFSYRDPVTHQPKSKRYFIGRVDPVTKQLLDPDKAQQLKQKRENNVSKQPEIKPETGTEPIPDEKNIFEELNQLKEMLQQEHEQLIKIQAEQRHTREAVLNAVKLIQESLLS